LTSAGLHKKGVQLPRDDWWGQLVQGTFTLISWGAFQVQIAFSMTLFYSSITKKILKWRLHNIKSEMLSIPPHRALSRALSGPDFAALWNRVVLPQGLTLCCVVK